MDIDEFLDREFSDIVFDKERTERHEPTAEFQKLNENVGQSPLFESARTYLGNGKLEDAEKSYIKLWQILLQQKLKWNKELYGQLSILNREFSTALDNASNELKIKTTQLYELIDRARTSLKEGKKEMSLKLYSEIEGINKSIPNIFFEEKKILHEQIIDLYKELKNVTDKDLINRVSALVQQINQLIDSIKMSIKANDVSNAFVNYDKCIELYNQIPQGFLRHKNSIGMGLLEIYKSISIYAEISTLQKQLGLAHSTLE